MSGVRSYNCNNLVLEKKSHFYLKIIADFLAHVDKNSYLCIIDAKRTKASKNCGITMKQNFLSARESVA
jgi:hypothetical protein